MAKRYVLGESVTARSRNQPLRSKWTIGSLPVFAYSSNGTEYSTWPFLMISK